MTSHSKSLAERAKRLNLEPREDGVVPDVGGVFLRKDDYQNLLAVKQAAEEYMQLWVRVHSWELEGLPEPTLDMRVRLGYIRGQLFAALDPEKRPDPQALARGQEGT
jgi:hypothetical protein